MKCPYCRSSNIIKKGQRKSKFGLKQFYLCKNCRKGFIDSNFLYKTYSSKVITTALSYYNLGNTLERAAKLTNKRFKVKVSKSSVSQWLKEFSKICTYHKIRQKVMKNYGKEILISKTFEHNGLAYNFKYHKPKLEMFCEDSCFVSLIKYIKNFEKGCPKFFDNIENRCSKTKIEVQIKKESKYNNACRLADFALKSCQNNSERHTTIENFMLINDSSTVACEVPIWFWEKNLDVGISGHIDLLQIRSNKICILDFKPKASKENEQKVVSQLFWYALGLSFRTSIPLGNFICAWFDEEIYHEFNPIEIKTKFQKATNSVSRVGNGFRKKTGFD